MSKFQKAHKSKSKLRLAITGSSGSGKTYTALAIASGLGKSIAVIDTENGSSSKYANLFPHDAANLQSFTVEDYTDVMRDAVSQKYDVVIIDSISPEWEQINNEKLALDVRFPANTWGNWAKIKPKHKNFIQEIISMPCHVICTMRTKTKYDDQMINGKKTKVKIGLEPIQQENIEYEFDMLLEMNLDHEGFVAKDRTSQFQDKIIDKPGKKFGMELQKWLNEGSDEPVDYAEPAEPVKVKTPLATQSVELATEKQIKMFFALCQEAYGDGWKEKGKEIVVSTGKASTKDLTKLEMSEIINRLSGEIDSAKAKINTDKTVYDQVMTILGNIKTKDDFESNESKINTLIKSIKDPKMNKEAIDVSEMLYENLYAEAMPELPDGELFNA